MDESFDPSQTGIFAIGTVLGGGVATYELDRKWYWLRKRPDIDIEYFKASDCERGKGQFAKFVRDHKNITPEERAKLDSISEEFNALTAKEEGITVQGLGVIQDDFYKIISEQRAKSILGDSPYRLAYKLSYLQAAWTMKKAEDDVIAKKLKQFNMSPTHFSVGFFVDECEQYSISAGPEYDELRRSHPKARKYMHTFAKGDDKDFDILQAADAWAFECRRRLNVAMGQRVGTKRRQFQMLEDRNKIFLISIFNQENMQHTVDTNEPGEPLNIDDIMEMQIHEDIKFVI